MSKKKKVVVTTNKRKTNPAGGATKAKVTAISSRHSEAILTFNRENYKWVIIGIVLVAVGMLLMLGGYNEDPNVWDEGQIYSLRRTLLAPVVILTGLCVEIYAIFK